MIDAVTLNTKAEATGKSAADWLLETPDGREILLADSELCHKIPKHERHHHAGLTGLFHHHTGHKHHEHHHEIKNTP